MKINEIFYSLQGEGNRVGSPNIFIRFSGCNLVCNFCDTEFESGNELSIKDILSKVREYPSKNIVLTGGEPGLQLTLELVNILKHSGYYLAIETNGTVDLSIFDLDWITLSPKVAEHAIKQEFANEIKYVRHYGQNIPNPRIETKYKYISPMFEGGYLRKMDLEWCVNLCKIHPEWSLTMQYHKIWKVR